MSKQKLWTKDYLFVLLATFFSAITHNIFTSVFPLYITSLGGNNTLTGAMISGQVIAGTVTRLICGNLQDRYGRRRMLIIGGILFALNTAAYNFTASIPLLFALRVLNGVSQGIYFGTAGTIIADVVPSERLVDGIGYFGIASSLAAAFSPMLGLFIFQNHDSTALLLFASAAAAVGALFPLLIKGAGPPKIQNRDTEPRRRKLKAPKLSSFIELSVLVPSFIAFFLVLGNSAVSNFLASCGVERGIESVGLYFVFHSAAMILSRLLAGALSRKFRLSLLIAAGMTLFTISLVTVAFAWTAAPVILAGILGGLGWGVVSPLLNSLVFKFSRPERKGVANSTYGLLIDIGGVGGSIWGGLSQFAGYTATYLMSSLSVFVGLLIHIFCLIPKIKKSPDGGE